MKFDYEAFDKWENENHIPEQVKRIVNAVLKSEGYEEPFGEIDTDCCDTTNEETISIRNRGGHVIGYGKGFSMSYCTSSLECGSLLTLSKVLVLLLRTVMETTVWIVLLTGTTLSGLMTLCISHLRYMKKSLSFGKTKIIVTKTYQLWQGLSIFM